MTRKASQASLLAMALGLLSAALTPMAALNVEDAIAPEGVVSAVISPDGKHIAAIGYTGQNHGLMMSDADTLDTKILIKGQKSLEGNWIYRKEPRRVAWVSNDLLAVDYGYTVESIDLKGKKVAEFGERLLGKAEPGNPDSMKMLVFTDAEDLDIAIADARTGDKRRFSFPMSGKPLHWAFDARGELRAITLANSEFWNDVTVVSNWYKPQDQDSWQKVAEFKVTDNYWIPMYVPEENNQLIISSSDGRNTRAIFRYDINKREIGEMMAGHPTQDIIQVGGIAQSEFRSVVTSGMRPEYYWFDETWAKLQASVDAALPDRVNILSGNPDHRILIHSYADVDPGTWYVLDIPAMTLREFARYSPKIDPGQMQPMQIMSYQARDGLTIPAYLTRPADAKGMQPTIIMIHGGPTVRDVWAWDKDVQLLAANGYVVFQPQFRGSSGFGRAFEEAGYGQWGLSMQDDVTAGVEYLIAQGIADPDRICIYGASYGGYAALWGLVKTPNLYRCGVSFAGVSDIEHMFKDWSDRNDNKAARQLMRARIGDLKQNKVQFDQVSPLKHADQVKAPVLLMHGSVDKRVPISHGKKMLEALRDQRKVVEWQVFEDEGHGLAYIDSQRRFYKILLAFLDKYIGPTKPAAPAPELQAAVATDSTQ